MEVMIIHAKLEKKPLEVKIGHPTPEVKVKIISGEKAMTKINPIRVTPDTGATAGLISNKLAYSLGCKVNNYSGEYSITGVDKKDLRILENTIVRLRFPSGDWETIMAVIVSKHSDSIFNE